MGVRRGWQGGLTTVFGKFQQKKVVFLVSSGKKQILPLLAPLEKFWKNPLVFPTWKMPF